MNEQDVMSLRARLTFATSGPLAYVSVLDLGRLWERALRRAKIPLRYSQGFNPRPKMQFAAPLPTGCGSEVEWLDIWLTEPCEPAVMKVSLADQCPPDLRVIEITLVPEDAPPLSEQMEAVTYRVLLRDVDVAELQAACAMLLEAESLLRAKRGRRRHQNYDLRQLIEMLNVAPAPEPWTGAVEMRLKAQAGATGRPDEVLNALGLADVHRRCTRTGLLLKTVTEEASP
ncbi:MAG: TIGR03936 family radical SAM-associated protein [Anaerolineae bacterium]|jgi:radical SAM-linked protein|nr:TIGR03936 family radical SAM-associated protein [Anaerolineae bacterium]